MPRPTQAPPVGSGIMQPAMQNRFIVIIERTPQEFAMQVVGAGFNLVKKQFMLFVEQSVSSPSAEHIVIQEMIDNPKREITLTILDNTGGIIDTLKFKNCVVTDHLVEFDYASSHPVMHNIMFEYEKIDLGAPMGNNYAFAMGIVGKP